MQQYLDIVEGTVTISGNDYDAELINDSLVIKKVKYNFKNAKSIINNTIEFIPKFNKKQTYYLYIDKIIISTHSCDEYHVLLLYRHYDDFEEISFEIMSKGFTNSINRSRHNLKTPFYNIKKNLEKEFIKTQISICDKKYEASFINRADYKVNNLLPIDFTTSLILKPIDGKFVDKIIDVYKFAISFLQFITLNTYTKIDKLLIINNVEGNSEIEINDNNNSSYDYDNTRYLYLNCLGTKICDVMNAFPDIMTRQHNAYHYKKEWVFEFDIVRLSGTFEGVFNKHVADDKDYLKLINSRKKEICYEELFRLLKDFEKEHKIKNNDDFDACMSSISKYSGTLKNKLEYVLTDFCKTMKMIQISADFFYSPEKFESRIKNSRNAICHGLNSKIDWKNIKFDTLLLQELIYFILLKYKIHLSPKKLVAVLDESFGYLNKELSFIKNKETKIN